jgi:hypothetical protein
MQRDAKWKKRSPEEIAAVRRTRQRDRIKGAIILGVLVTLGTSLLFGWREAGDRARVLVPTQEILNRLPLTLVFGIIAALLSYISTSRKKPTVVCPKCGTLKYSGASAQCPCGGHFENIEEMDWV